MGLGELLTVSSRLPIESMKLTKTKRPFFLQSLTLVYACRQIPEPSRLDRGQQRSLEELMKKVESALRSGTTAKKISPEVSKQFAEAHEDLRKYLAKYNVELVALINNGNAIQANAMKEANQRDKEAEKQIEEINGRIKNKMAELEKVPLMHVSINFWPAQPTSLVQQRRNGRNGWQLRHHNVQLENQIKIDELATLDMLLHRFLEYTATVKLLNGSVSLIQYPQFYAVFPHDKMEFEAIAKKQQGRIPSLDPWKTVKNSVQKKAPLHLIVERKADDEKSLTLWNGSQISMPEDCKNAWHLKDSEAVIVRRRTPSFSLRLLHPDEMSSTTSTNLQSSSEAIEISTSVQSREQHDRPSQESLSVQNDPRRAKQGSPKSGLGDQAGPFTTEAGRRQSTLYSSRKDEMKRPVERLSKQEERLASRHADGSDTTLIEQQSRPHVKEYPTDTPAPIAGPSRPRLEHALSSSPTLVDTKQPAKIDVPARSSSFNLPTFEGDLMESSSTIGMSPVQKTKKKEKQGWGTWGKGLIRGLWQGGS
ncbi:hypothetical protein CVT26_008979 [Gymnopilus dilepis]|uniref:Uncharacterized protein n=1 Tax=Gymnopilus dilepis TaxID=231916 RepID=A0A409YB55_9AGAR|nr:hypothetical protein CVT26_008979 [Gymnopilus dilepis]